MYTKGYSTSASSLTKIANQLSRAADKIGARGEGAVLRDGGHSDSDYAAAPRVDYGFFSIHSGIKLYDGYFDEKNSLAREQVILHESMHLDGIYGDAYRKEGIDSLIGNEKAFWKNADTYACLPYPSACGY